MKLRVIAAAAAAILLSAAAHAATMQCAPNQPFSGAAFPGGNSGAGYTSDADGIVTGVGANDIDALVKGGCKQVGNAGYTLIGRIVGANMNVTTDQPATSFMGPNSYYVPANMITKDCSTSLTTVKGAVYDAASKGGNILFGSATQVFTGCTGAGTAATLAAIAAAQFLDPSTTPPILSLTTIQGGAATANVYFYGYVLGK